MKTKNLLYIVFGLVCLSLLTPLIINKNFLFPFISPRAFYFRIMLDFALAFYVYLILARKEYRPSLKNPLTAAVLAFLVLNIVSSIFGVGFLKSFWGNIERMGGAWYLLHLCLLYLYILMLSQANGKLFLYVLKFFLWVSIISVLYGVWVLLGFPGFFADPSLPGRVSSTFGNPIFFASFLVLPLFLTLYFSLQETGWFMRSVYIVVAILQLLGIYQSATRGAVIGLIVGLLVFGVAYLLGAGSRKIKIYGGVVLVVMLAVIGLLFYFNNRLQPGSMLHRMTHLIDSNSEARLLQWQVALRGFKDAPLLGVGPENYYFISNEYYNPQIYHSDPSWFDKPHNYLLEILVTTGALGFAAYVAILGAFTWILYKAFKARLLSWLEFCLLLSGMVVYQVQNLFVFDTISASIAFFVYLGFVGYLWYETQQQAEVREVRHSALGNMFLNTVFVLVLIVMVYVSYLTNWVSGRYSKDINYGYAYAAVDPVISKSYFDKALSQQFIFDPLELAGRYGDAANQALGSSVATSNPQAVSQLFDGAISTLEWATTKVDNNPIYLTELVGLYVQKASMTNQPLNPAAVVAAQKALALAPERYETMSYMMQVDLMQGQALAAVAMAQKIVELYPFSPEAKWRLGLVYQATGQMELAITSAQQALDQGFIVNAPSDMSWLINYYQQKKDYNQIVTIYEQAVQNNPKNLTLIVALAKAYLQAGEPDKAQAVKNEVLANSPAQAAQWDELMNATSTK